MKKILLLGKNGMLGHLVTDYMNSLKDYTVIALGRNELDVLKLSDLDIEFILQKYYPFSYIINCVGLINKNPELNEQNAKRINSDFPHLLAYLGMKHGFKLIHVSTDCYLDQDLYGRSKFLGEVNDHHNLTIRTSIIGPELNDKGTGLFNWFMAQNEEVNGFTNAYWDGVTTLQLAKFMQECIENNDKTGIIDYRTKKSISKFSLLELIAKVFNKQIQVNKDNRNLPDKRNKNPDFFCTVNYSDQINQLKDYMISNKIYKKYFK